MFTPRVTVDSVSLVCLQLLVRASLAPRCKFWGVWTLFIWKEVIAKMSDAMDWWSPESATGFVLGPPNLCKLYGLQKLILDHVSKAIHSLMIYNWLGSYSHVHFQGNKQILTAPIKRHKPLSKEQQGEKKLSVSHFLLKNCKKNSFCKNSHLFIAERSLFPDIEYHNKWSRTLAVYTDSSQHTPRCHFSAPKLSCCRAHRATEYFR